MIFDKILSQKSFVVGTEYTASEDVSQITGSVIAGNASMLIYDANLNVTDNLTIGQVVTVAVDYGQQIDKNLTLKQCTVTGGDVKINIIENYEVIQVITVFYNI